MVEIATDRVSLAKYSNDRSPYSIRPQMIAFPKSEKDVQEILNEAKENSLPITARGAGSNLSGSAVGSGIIVDFSKMKSVKKIVKSRVWVEPGVIHEKLNEKVKSRKLFLPFAPSSAKFCTLGGNLSTKAAGLRSVKYGSMDAFVKSVRFVDVQGRIIDTSENLPADIEEKISALRKKLMADKKAMKVLKRRESLKSSSGYNLSAIYKYKYPGDIVTHLLVGSVGTLGLVTQIELELRKLPSKKITCLAFFETLKESGAAVMDIKKLGPSALEIMDVFSLSILRKSGFKIPDVAKAALLIEFDSNLGQSGKTLQVILKRHHAEYDIEEEPEKQKKLWKIRSELLTIAEKENNVIAFVEDMGVPPKHIAAFIEDLENIFARNNTKSIIFGHAGEGNLHVRPVINSSNWKSGVKKLADECYAAVFRYGGTVTAEHGAGRNKSPYMEKEWGSDVYKYFLEVKKIFDPEGILNPGVMFSEKNITDEMKFDSTR